MSFDKPQTGGVKSGDAAVVPNPDKVIVVGELVASLVMVAVPVALADVVGENETVSEAVSPGSMTVPSDMPSTLNPAPDADTPEIVAFALPVFVTVTTWLPTFPTTTFGKLTLAGLADSAAPAMGLGASGVLADWLADPQPATMPAP